MKRQSKVTADFSGLQVLTEDAVENRGARVKVGVLSNKAEREAEDITEDKVGKAAWRRAFAVHRGLIRGGQKAGMSNPEIGLIHEFGSVSDNIPARSFLRVPLTTELPGKMRLIGEKVWASLVQKRGIYHALEELGLIGVQVVEMAFRTAGYGRWKPLAPITIWIKGSSRPLIDSGQLRRSISSAVVGAERA